MLQWQDETMGEVDLGCWHLLDLARGVMGVHCLSPSFLGFGEAKEGMHRVIS